MRKLEDLDVVQKQGKKEKETRGWWNKGGGGVRVKEGQGVGVSTWEKNWKNQKYVL
jgi:hypothetical protein